MSKKGKLPPLEEGLLLSARAIDNQVAREMQRSPAEVERHGVQKWKPYSDRVEKAATFLLNAVESEEIGLDGFIVLAQAWSKALYLLIDDLGPDGLGQIRSSYCRAAMEAISDDASRALGALGSERNLN